MNINIFYDNNNDSYSHGRFMINYYENTMLIYLDEKIIKDKFITMLNELIYKMKNNETCFCVFNDKRCSVDFNYIQKHTMRNDCDKLTIGMKYNDIHVEFSIKINNLNEKKNMEYLLQNELNKIILDIP